MYRYGSLMYRYGSLIPFSIVKHRYTLSSYRHISQNNNDPINILNKQLSKGYFSLFDMFSYIYILDFIYMLYIIYLFSFIIYIDIYILYSYIDLYSVYVFVILRLVSKSKCLYVMCICILCAYKGYVKVYMFVYMLFI
eukprot:GHVR01148730.1.p1 GENE.GHVR01148730.1~~GHVR01148730.1.p1  ORF type:complete len:138 (+),score=7.83 GHVR01148730.1:86-499(+)